MPFIYIGIRVNVYIWNYQRRNQLSNCRLRNTPPPTLYWFSVFELVFFRSNVARPLSAGGRSPSNWHFVWSRDFRFAWLDWMASIKKSKRFQDFEILCQKPSTSLHRGSWSLAKFNRVFYCTHLDIHLLTHTPNSTPTTRTLTCLYTVTCTRARSHTHTLTHSTAGRWN